MMSHCIVPKWNNVRAQQIRQEEVVLLVEEEEAVEGGDERNRSSSHVHPSTTDQNQNGRLTYLTTSTVPMPNYEVTTELTWENGQLGLHGLGGMVPAPSTTAQPKQLQTWSNTNNNKPVDTLESIVHQATANNHLPQYNHHHHHHQAGKWGENSASHVQMEEQQHINQQNQSSLMQGKWRENGAAMTVGVVNSSMNNSNNCGGKWRENSDQGERGVKKLMMSSMASSSGGGGAGGGAGLVNKRVRSESNNNNNNNCGRINKSNFEVEDQSACASASATFCRDNDTTMMTWPSFESPRSMKTAPNAADDDSAYQDCSENQEGERMTKGESFRSQSSTRRSRAATVHNQSERRRRDRINEKMKALQKLVPNASKTDKASMLDEVIEYLKQLQSQVHMMSNARNMPQMVMPPQLGMQHQIQMSLLARMGMGMGMGMDMGMLDVARNHVPHSFPQLIHQAAPLGATTTSFVPPPFTMAPVNPLKANVNGASSFNDAYNTFIAQQSMNMDFLNKMSALYRQQQANQAQQMTSKKAVNSSMPNHGQGD